MTGKCKWCGSRKHKSTACAIKHKHQALLDGVPLARCGFDAIIEVDLDKQKAEMNNRKLQIKIKTIRECEKAIYDRWMYSGLSYCGGMQEAIRILRSKRKRFKRRGTDGATEGNPAGKEK